jgi:phosphopantothenate---cysteine ligase (CTP)
MKSLKGKNILITSGGTIEKWDEVRAHTNLSTGTMGSYLANDALNSGANVIYLHGYFANLPPEHKSMRAYKFEGILDLQEKIHSLITTERIDAVIMACAGSDWTVDEIYDKNGNVIENNGKISSDNPPTIRFKKAPKVLSKIKTWDPKTILVGFKLEHSHNEKDIIQKAKTRMHESNAEFMVVNQTKSLYDKDTEHYILFKDGDYRQSGNKKSTSIEVIKYLSYKLN